jgi:hypothetical protein
MTSFVLGTARATLFGGTEDADLLKRYRDVGAARVVVTLPPETADKTLPVRDRWADLIRRSTRKESEGVGLGACDPIALSISALHRVAAGLVVGPDDVLAVGVGNKRYDAVAPPPTEPQADTSPSFVAPAHRFSLDLSHVCLLIWMPHRSPHLYVVERSGPIKIVSARR